MAEAERVKVLWVRMSLEERAWLDELAAREGMSGPAWVRWMVRRSRERTVGHE